MHFEESKKLQQQQFRDTSEIAQRALSLSENQSENERVYKKIVMLNDMIKDTEERIQLWKFFGKDIRDFEDNLTEARELSANATVTWNNRDYGNADKLIEEAYYFLVKIPFPQPAAYITSGFSISPAEVNIGESVTISTTVSNTGDLAGSYKVTLKINNIVEDTKDVTFDAHTSKTITFTTVKDIAGTYTVDVNGLSGTFTITAPVRPLIPWCVWLIVGLAIVAVIGVIVWVVVIRPRFRIFFTGGRIVIRHKE
jgi:hypothetical protein